MAQFPKRVNDSLVGGLERRILAYLVRRIPDRVTSHHLTALGLMGGIVAGAGYALSSLSSAFLWLAIFGIVLNWFGDSLDGNLARYRNMPSRAGAFADHTIDALAELILMIGLGLSPFVRMDVALAALVGYYLMIILTMSRAVAGIDFRISYGHLGPTEVRLGLIAVTIGMFFLDADPRLIFGVPGTIFDILLLAFALGISLLFLVSLISTIRALSR